MSPKNKKQTGHIHKFKREDLSGDPRKKYLVFKCVQPGCSTYYKIKLSLGQLGECWTCGDPFIMDKVSITHARPHCNNCIKRKVKSIVSDLSELAKDI